MTFNTAIQEIKESMSPGLEQAKFMVFIERNREFLQRVFEDNAISGIPVKLGEDIENFDTYALQVVDKLRDIKEKTSKAL